MNPRSWYGFHTEGNGRVPRTQEAPGAAPGHDTGRDRLHSLTSLRFFAALAVFASHIYYYVWHRSESFAEELLPDLAFRLAFAGVSFFFVLSGFVLTWSRQPSDTPLSFWRRRLAKIYPNHLVTWLIALALLLWSGQQVSYIQGVSPLQAWSTLFLVDAWILDERVLSGVNSVSWTLACEAFFYLCFPLLFALVAKIRPALLWVYAAGCVVAITAIPVAIMYLTPSEPALYGLPLTQLQDWLTYRFPLTRLFEFVLGMVLARIVLTGTPHPARFRYALLAIPLGLLLALTLEYPYGVAGALVVPLSLLLLATAHADIGRRLTFLRWRPLIWLGDISFALYMVHLLVIQYTYPLVDPTGTAGSGVRAALSAAYLAACVLAAWWLYALVERPVMRRWGTSRPKRRVDSAAVPAGAAATNRSTAIDTSGVDR